ncbi:MAG: hypothetical protein ACTSW1_18220 [Candidatus Hodarchaeales archaeon]
MSTQPNQNPTRSFQFRLTVEEWMSAEFERVTIQYENLLDVIDRVRFFGVNGLIRRENKKVSPFYFQLVEQDEEILLVIIFSIPIFQSFSVITVQTNMEYFASILKYTLCEKMSIDEAEIESYKDIQKLHPIHRGKREIVPYQDLAENIELQLRMKVRLGIQIIPTETIFENIKNERMKHLTEIKIAKKALINVQSSLKGYSNQIANKYRINVVPAIFQASIESKFEPIFIPNFTIISSSQSSFLFSIVVITDEVIKRIESKHLEILLAHEIIFDILKSKFSRGIVEREIFQILSENHKNDPEYFIEKELGKFYQATEIENARKSIQQVVNDLIDEGYPVIQLDET